ncbi:MAG: IS481 family transposase, partial [Egibacteraceae bacterium]
DQRLAVLSEPGWSGRSVREVCARHGISPDTFYAWKRRYEAEGLQGLIPRDRRPRRSPAQLAVEVEDRVLWLRQEYGWGPRKIRDALRAELAGTGLGVPAVSTIQQALARSGVLTPRRRKPRPPTPPRRFARAASNQLWQIDGALHHLAGGRPFWVVDLIDDHSRFCLATMLGTSLTGHLAWDTLRAAVAAYGLPEALLSDNGLCFTGRLHNIEVFFERQAHRAGIRLYHSRPYHPQTCGKIERLHATVRGYLATHHDPPATYPHARTQLEAFRAHYNQQRPHQALNGVTPATVYRPGTGLLLPTIDLAPTDTHPPGCLPRKISPNGRLCYAGRTFRLEQRWAGLTIGARRDGARLELYYGHTLIRTFLVGTTLPTPTR